VPTNSLTIYIQRGVHAIGVGPWLLLKNNNNTNHEEVIYVLLKLEVDVIVPVRYFHQWTMMMHPSDFVVSVSLRLIRMRMDVNYKCIEEITSRYNPVYD
jgi:hypothetical protein